MVKASPPHIRHGVKAAGGDGASLDAVRSQIVANAEEAMRPVNGAYNRLTAADDVLLQRNRATKIIDEAAAADVVREDASRRSVDHIVAAGDHILQGAAFAPILVGGAQMGTKAALWTGSKIKQLAGYQPSSVPGTLQRAVEHDWNSFSFNQLGDATRTRGVVGNTAQYVADSSAGLIDTLARKTGLSGWRSAKNIANAEKSLAAAQQAAGSLSYSDLSVLGDLTTTVRGATHHSHIATDGTRNLIAGIRESEGFANLSADGSKFLSKVEDTIGHSEGAAMWGDVKSAVKRAPSEIGKGSATHGLMNAAFIGMSALSMFGDARTFSQNLESLRQMYADITGEDVKKVSTITLLTGSVPEPVAAARSHMIKTFGMKQVLDVANIAANVAMVVNPRFGGGWKGLAALIGTQIASTAVDGVMGESILPVHKAFSDAYKTGREIPAEFYAAYLYAASKELNKRGEKGQEFAAAVANEYAAERASPAQVLQEIENGKLLERIKNIASKADVQQAVITEQAPENTAVARLNGQRNERPIVGKFTGKLNQEAQITGLGHGVA